MTITPSLSSAIGSSTPNVFLSGGHGFGSLYTRAVLESYCKAAGVPIVKDIEESAVVWFSCCDPDDLSALKKTHRDAKGKPIIMGGFDAFLTRAYFAWVDAMVIGEGWEFISTWGKSPKDALELPCVATSPKDDVTPSNTIAWENIPILKPPGGKRLYYLGGRGCKGKCKFCATSWTQPYVNAPQGLIKQVIKYAESVGGRLSLVSNDSDPVVESSVVNAQSVRVVDYLKEPKRYKSTMLHLGIEGWTEKCRANMSKPIRDDEIRALIRALKHNKQKAEFFFILNYPGFEHGMIEAFAESVIEADADKSPTIHVKMTYFDPCPHTPWADYDISGARWVDTKQVFKMLNSRNKRIRVFPTRSVARAAWRTCFHRATPEEALRLGKEPTETNCAEAMPLFVQRLEGLGLTHLLKGKR